MDRSSDVLEPGKYTVMIQVATTDPGVYFWIADWHLTVETVQV